MNFEQGARYRRTSIVHERQRRQKKEEEKKIVDRDTVLIS